MHATAHSTPKRSRESLFALSKRWMGWWGWWLSLNYFLATDDVDALWQWLELLLAFAYHHTLLVLRNDTIEVSTLVGCLLRDITSMYYSRLQSYGEFSNNSLSAIFPLFPFVSLCFIGVIKSTKISFILQPKRANYGMMTQAKDTSYYRWLAPKMQRRNETYSWQFVVMTNYCQYNRLQEL